MKRYINFLFLIFILNGCAEIVTSVAINTGVQLVGERYLIANKSPVIKCNAINVLKGNKFCRVTQTYKVEYARKRQNRI
jgi:hypothetical protein